MTTIANIWCGLNQEDRITYCTAGAEPMWLMLSLMSLMKRLPRSGKKAVVEEVVAGSSHRSVLHKNLIAPLLHRITKGGVQRTAVPSRDARRKEGWREVRGGAKIWNGAKPYDTAAARVEHVRSVVRVRPSIIVLPPSRFTGHAHRSRLRI